MPSPDLCYYGAGTLSSTVEDNIIVNFAQDTTSSAVITNGALAAGAANNSNTVTVQSVTPYTGAFTVGQGVKVTGTGGSTYHSVFSIPSSTQLVLTPNTTVTGTITLNKFFKRGTTVSLAGVSNTAVVASNRASVTVNMAMYPDLNTYTMNAQIPVTRTTAQPIPKVVRKNTFVKIDCSTGGTTGPWGLGHADVYKVANVHVGSTYADTNTDRSDWFELDSGQQDNMYNIAKLKLKPQYNGVLTSASRLLVKMHHFTPNSTSSAALFYSEESYPIDDANTANNSAIVTAEIPVYKNDKGIYYDLRNCIDFRPMASNTAVLATTAAAATINPVANAGSFYSTSGAPVAVEPDSNFSYNVEYYLPRKDVLLINSDGTLNVKRGDPAIDPKLPAINKSGLKIAEITVPPYPSLTFKEAE